MSRQKLIVFGQRHTQSISLLQVRREPARERAQAYFDKLYDFSMTVFEPYT